MRLGIDRFDPHRIVCFDRFQVGFARIHAPAVVLTVLVQTTPAFGPALVLGRCSLFMSWSSLRS
jgi:hypothetical protein